MSHDEAAAGRPIVLWSLFVYAGASLWHFAHNALYIDAYPNLPASLSALRVWLAWAALTCLGATGYVLVRFGRRRLGLWLIGFYGLLGFYGLAHYALAPFQAHTLTMHLTILGEAAAAAVLVMAAARGVWDAHSLGPKAVSE